jgi:thioredoxin reductase/bacterioferritin-associated ferredoxin
MSFDLIVIGAGPAGSAAALAAARHGLSVQLIDEAESAGGQTYRAPAPWKLIAPEKGDDDTVAGNELRAALAASKVQTFYGRRVWTISRGFEVYAVSEEGSESFSAPRIIAATGAHERVVPFPGWTLPGVIGLAAATILMKSQGMLPGRRVVVAGCGPLLVSVAAKIVSGGGDLAAVVDLAGPSDWLSTLPALLRRSRLLSCGIGWMLAIGKARIPVYFRHGVRAAEGQNRVGRVLIGPVDKAGATVGGREKAFDVDTLVVGHGLAAGAEVPKLLRAGMVYDRLRGGWVPQVDTCGRTSVDGLFAIGDGAGIRGAEPAAIAGTIAGLAAARDAGRLPAGAFATSMAALGRKWRSYRAFADAIGGLMMPRPAQVDAITPDTVVCRCEDVTRASIDAAARDGAADVNQLKHFTRCGMGPCQGRMCEDAAAELLAQARGVARESVGFWTGRPPLRPVPLQVLVGTFNYSDIPIPKPAPL